MSQPDDLRPPTPRPIACLTILPRFCARGHLHIICISEFVVVRQSLFWIEEHPRLGVGQSVALEPGSLEHLDNFGLQPPENVTSILNSAVLCVSVFKLSVFCSFVRPSVRPFVLLSCCPAVLLSLRLFVCLCVCLSAPLSVRQSCFLFVCLLVSR